MKPFQTFIFVVFCLSPLFMGSTPVELETAKNTPPEYCGLRGAVYVEDVAAFAKYRVFVEDIESFADLVVFKEDSEGFANDPGHWYFTDVRGFADFTIYIEDVKGFADFSIAYTEFRTTVGCQ